MAIKSDELTDLGAVIAQGIAQGIAAVQPPREIKEGDPEYVARQRAEGWFDEFPVKVFQNGYEAQARGLSAEVRERAASLKPGSYIRGRVRVEKWPNGINLSYPTKGDAMLINRDYFTDFSDMVNKIWAEMSVPVPA